jgi:hypothetical protein
MHHTVRLQYTSVTSSVNPNSNQLTLDMSLAYKGLAAMLRHLVTPSHADPQVALLS